VDVGLGYATPLIIGNRIYMFSRQDEDEVMSALDAGSGAVSGRPVGADHDEPPPHATARVRSPRPCSPKAACSPSA
jgi:hypothetical protein